MEFRFSFINILILFGALQGFTLCFYLLQKKDVNPRAVLYFILFLFSLAFLNMNYAFLDMDFFQIWRPLHLFPIPYKWLIGIGFYFYIKNLLPPGFRKNYFKYDQLLWIPALIYTVLRTYWFIISVKENSYRITGEIVDTGFFRIHEIFFLVFTIVLLIYSIMAINRYRKHSDFPTRYTSNFKLIQKISFIFLMIVTLQLGVYISDLIIHHGKETLLFIYPGLILNVLFIYWIGFLGFSNYKLLFVRLKESLQNSASNLQAQTIEHLNTLFEKDEVYKDQRLNLERLAVKLEVPSKDLSRYVQSKGFRNFSEYLNHYRVEKIKQLLSSADADRFTLLSLAETAGFSSKSSFNSIFKRLSGMTPSEYRKSLERES